MKCCECNEPAVWRIKNYFTEGSPAERKHGTRDRRMCGEHVRRAWANPFNGVIEAIK